LLALAQLKMKVMGNQYSKKGLSRDDSVKLSTPRAAVIYPGLWQAYLPIISNFIIQNSGTHQDAEDLFQDALIIYMRRYRNNQLELHCQPGTFIYSIVKNLWKKRLRRKRYELHYAANYREKCEVDEPVTQYRELDWTKDCLKKAFLRLPCPCRRILNYFYFHEMRYEQIIEVLNISTIQVAKNRKMRCLQQLKKYARQEVKREAT
jgi:RNA polymerase sigma factor (sigma-70 family)